MKDVGPVKRTDKALHLHVYAERPSGGNMFEHLHAQTLPDPLWRIKFEFIQELRGAEARTLTIEMEARYRGDDNKFRDELLESKVATSFGLSSTVTHYDNYPGQVTNLIHDPLGIIPWLFPNMDMADFFTQQKPINDQPLRLPARTI